MQFVLPLINEILLMPVTCNFTDTALDGREHPDNYFSYFSTKIYIVGTHEKRLGEALLMSTYNIYFYGEIRRISYLWG